MYFIVWGVHGTFIRYECQVKMKKNTLVIPHKFTSQLINPLPDYSSLPSSNHQWCGWNNRIRYEFSKSGGNIGNDLLEN